MDGPGTLTWEEFVADSELLVELSNKISDHWEFLGDKKTPGEAYLKRQEKIFVPFDYPIDEPEAVGDFNEEWETKLCTDPYEISHPAERPLIMEHHILWSMSYSVPVIYFNGWKSDFPGMDPVSVEVAQGMFKNERLAYGELSQAMHPLLGRPFLHLHPCGSRDILSSMSSSANKVISWLSVVAPAALNLRLRPEYYQLTVKSS